MMTSIMLALTLASLKIEAPQFQAPKMDLDLPGVPRVEGLQGRAAKAPEFDTRKVEESETLKVSPARVEEVQLSKSFVPTRRGLKAIEPVDAFLVASLPAQLPAFKACVRVSSAERIPTRVKVQVRLPGGAELWSATKTVSFEKESTDVVFELGALDVRQAGSYRVVVSLDGEQAAEAGLEIKQLKQAAEPSGR